MITWDTVEADRTWLKRYGVDDTFDYRILEVTPEWTELVITNSETGDFIIVDVKGSSSKIHAMVLAESFHVTGMIKVDRSDMCTVTDYHIRTGQNRRTGVEDRA